MRKGLVTQTADAGDQRQRVLSLTRAGVKLWSELPDPIALTGAVAFEGADEADLEVARRVLRTATHRLTDRA